MTGKLMVAAIAAILLAPAAAAAHVTLQPKEVAAGGFTRLNVRVPNEKDDEGTTKIEIEMPPGFAAVSYEPVAGWDIEVTKRKLDTPIKLHGLDVTEEVGTVTFSGDGKEGIIAPGQFRDFGLSVGVPEGAAGSELTFKALQTYEGGEVVRWIGEADSDKPAPQITLTEAAGGHGAAAPAAATPEATAGHSDAAAKDDDGEEDSDGLGLIALIVGGLGLLVGGAALMTARKRPATA